MSRIAIIDDDKCQPTKCKKECMKYCPVNTIGKECVSIMEKKDISVDIEDIGKKWKAKISEYLCIGCGMCVQKCPFDAIKIINIPNMENIPVIYKYGINRFQLHRLPQPRFKAVTGLLGVNGIGKSTITKILSGKLVPNMGEEEEKEEDYIIKYFRGSDLQKYFISLYKKENKSFKVVVKPQNITALEKSFGEQPIGDFLKAKYNASQVEKAVELFSLSKISERKFYMLSGGECQRVALALCFLAEAQCYIFDEPFNFLDIKQRIKIAEQINSLSKRDICFYTFIIEHDLSLLDYISDYICILYGEQGAYGIVSQPQTAKEGINMFLEGYIPSENMRFRENNISFSPTDIENEEKRKTKSDYNYPDIDYRIEDFSLHIKGSGWNKSEIIVVVGENGTGKTTLVKLLAGVNKNEKIPQMNISYKPQILNPKFQGSVEELLQLKIPHSYNNALFISDVIKPLQIEKLKKRKLQTLSGGELQRTAIAMALGKAADIYLLDEPLSDLDIEMKLSACLAIKRFIRNSKSSCFIVEHDIMMSAYLADKVILCTGEAGKKCVSSSIMEREEGMNSLMREMNITIRQDETTKRPRINKVNSVLDREQKEKGEYFKLEKRNL